MSEWSSRHRRMRAAVLVAGGLTVGLLAVAFILVGVDRATRAPASTGDATSHSPAVPPVTGGTPPPLESHDPPTRAADDRRPRQAVPPLPPLPDSDDPNTYAAAVAEVLFGMNYTDHTPADYEAYFDEALWDEIDADDRGRTLATIRRRIPTPEMWEQMRSVQQTSEFGVELVWEPRTSREHREAGDWPAGMLIRNVSGTQTETWRAQDEDEQSSTRPVTVSIGIVCPPATSPCRVVGIFPTAVS